MHLIPSMIFSVIGKWKVTSTPIDGHLLVLIRSMFTSISNLRQPLICTELYVELPIFFSEISLRYCKYKSARMQSNETSPHDHWPPEAANRSFHWMHVTQIFARQVNLLICCFRRLNDIDPSKELNDERKQRQKARIGSYFLETHVCRKILHKMRER